MFNKFRTDKVPTKAETTLDVNVMRAKQRRRVKGEDKKSLPSGYALVTIEEDSKPLSQEEYKAVSDITSVKGVYYKPRKTKTTKPNGIKPHKWEALGFPSAEDYEGWLMFNYRQITEEEMLDDKMH
ncbi:MULTISPECIES: hypothetical protein [Erwiniaceae]|uniref:Uncharacterized protein n=2 Tax=Erwiniaceae TaxID=1903409 RepID=A0A4U3F5K4_9GAMM|nr:MULTISPECIES: hypothetical protein [Erwiniaceae]MCQ8226427.1 hypothetical protein [Pantoea sp. MMK2]MCQ8238347.1 hypothetical protein [Pantoea sp. MMK3]TKJ88701.1 hypothetical protein EpCFBP13511_14820 [Erwinia persicina]